MAQQIRQDYSGFVVHSQLHKNHFTTSAIDNFDYHLTSTTANISIHWTRISIFQHPEERLDTAPFHVDSHSKITEKLELPLSYTDTHPLLGGKPETIIHTDENEDCTSVMEEEKEWTRVLMLGEYSERILFASFYS